MRRAVTLFAVALLAAPMAFAQTPAGAGNNPPSTPQPQSQKSTQPGEDTRVGTGQTQNPNTVSQPGASNSTTGNSTTGLPGQNAPSAASSFDQIAAGTEVRAVLDTPLSTKTSKPGDRFTATIAEPARGSGGSVVFPTGARIEGEVADAEENKTLAALKDKGKLSLRFRDVVLPNGQTLPLTATLISVNDTNGKGTKKADAEARNESGVSGRDVAKDTNTGPGIGAQTGLVFGSPLKGLAIGAQAGGGYVLATKAKDVRLPAQTGMVIRLDQPVSANAQPR